MNLFNTRFLDLSLILSVAVSLACSSDKVEKGQENTASALAERVHRRGLHNANSMIANAELCQPALKATNIAACEAACLLNHSNSCANWGSLLSSRSQARASELYLRACTGGSGIGCEAKARMEVERPGGEHHRFFKEARFYHRVHCTQKYSRSCYQLAALYEDGLGGEVNQSAALEFRRKACILGVQSACE